MNNKQERGSAAAMRANFLVIFALYDLRVIENSRSPWHLQCRMWKMNRSNAECSNHSDTSL
jgi:hypothetical protein